MFRKNKRILRLLALICAVAVTAGSFSGCAPAVVVGLLAEAWPTEQTFNYDDNTFHGEQEDLYTYPEVFQTEPVAEAPGQSVIPYTDKTVPDIQSFSGGKMLEYEPEMVTGGIKYIVCNDNKLEFLYEYIDLLRQNFTQVGYRQVSSIDSYEYGFIYNGSDADSLSQIPAEKVGLKFDGVTHVHVGVEYILGEIHVFVADGLTYGDTGHRSTTQLLDKSQSDTSGGSGGGGGSNFEHNGVPTSPYGCLRCDNEGKIRCSSCSGQGGKTEYHSSPNYSGSILGPNSSEKWVVCWRCDGTGTIDCPSC